MPKPQETEKERLLRHAAALRELAARLERTARNLAEPAPQRRVRW